MKDRRTVDELSLEELEEVLRVRRRTERLRRLDNKSRSLDPLRDQTAPEDVTPTGNRMESEVRAFSGPRYSALIEPGAVKRARPPIQWRWVRDQVLLLIEILAVVGFILVVVRMFTTVQTLNEDSRAIQALPTPTATPLIDVVVLPGGHTPPDALGHSAPAPIPAHLQSLVAAITPRPVPTPGSEHARRIVVPVIGVDALVVEGDDWESLKSGAGHTPWSANPGERGNCIISAHNDIYGEIFRDLSKLRVGDEIAVDTQTQTYRYIVQQTRIIDPNDPDEARSVMGPTNSPVLTLISCYPYGVDSHRIVVIATLAP